jgi:hypothetical protein
VAFLVNARSIIRSLLAGLLLVVFAFSITPRQALHNWLADHEDTTHPHCDYGDVTHYGNYGFHCECDNLVAESPFTSQEDIIEYHSLPVFAGRRGFIAHCFYAEAPGVFSLRGPPAAVSSL